MNESSDHQVVRYGERTQLFNLLEIMYLIYLIRDWLQFFFFFGQTDLVCQHEFERCQKIEKRKVFYFLTLRSLEEKI